MITVFTPTYNRVMTLTRLFKSLCEQSSYDFEWVVVDDGSTDDTCHIIDDMISENPPFSISFVRQENGGKHRAINTGVNIAKGELFFIVDSDDYLRPTAIEIINRTYSAIKSNENYCGVVVSRCYENGDVVGGVANNIDTDFLSYRMKYHMPGDRAEVVKTSIMKQFPFPEFKGEIFCTEAVVWNRIAQRYIARYVDERVYVCEYLKGGLTNSIRKLLKNNPKGMALYYLELFSYGIPFWHKIKAGINYWRYASMRNSVPYKLPLSIYLYAPLGILLHWENRITKI